MNYLLKEIEHTFIDTYLLIPLLFIVYLLLEYLEHTSKLDKLHNFKLNPFIGALMGLIPQCGFSVISSILFLENKITLGTLISIFIATNDEGLTLLLSLKGFNHEVIMLMIIKLLLASVVGYLVDCFIHYKHPVMMRKEHKHDSSSLIIEAIKHTIIVYSFIFIIDMMLCILIDHIGKDVLAKIMLEESMMQPFLSALIGFIPHCTSSILLIELYLSSIISYASLLSGLTTNAGLGLLTLFQYRLNIKMILTICLILLVSSLIISIPFQWFYLL